MRKTASASVLAMILCAACLLPSIVVADAGPDSGTEKDPAENALPTNVLTAEELLYGILTLGGLESPDLMFCYNDNDFSERFESFYHRDVPSVGDMAFAVSSGMSADEIAVIVPGSGCGEDEITDMLRSHIEEEEDVYELYSPTDAANLQNAYIGEEGGFIVLIISADQSGILDVLRSCLRSPDKLPAPPSRDTDVTAGTDEPETTDKPETTGEPETTDKPETAGSPETTGEPETTALKPETTAPKPETTAPKPETTAPKPETTAPKPETTAPKPETTAPKPETETTGPFDDTYYPDEIYTYENALPEREHVPDGFFSDAIFVGDSRLAGIMLYSKPKVAGDFAVVSLNVSTVFTRKAIDMGDGKKITVADAIRRTEFNKCYIMFGINELSWPSPAGFIKNYKKVINLIREVNPDVEIYILNVFPVTVKYWEKHPKMGNDRVQNLDRLIAKMAWEENLKLVNVAGALSDEYGNLPASCSSDGVHGNRSTCRKLFDYMCTHW